MAMNIKKIYSKQEVMVSDDLINSSDSVINSTLPNCEPGTIIYTAGYSSVKQKSIDNTWAPVSLGASGSAGKDGVDGKSAYELAKELDPDIGDLQTWLASLKGDKGEPGTTGPAGAKGDNGANGKDGSDGVSPTVVTSAVAGGTQVTITDKDGEHQFTVLNGKDGTNGSNGAQGEKGIGVKGLTLTVDTTGKITGGTLTLTDESQVSITINTSD